MSVPMHLPPSRAAVVEVIHVPAMRGDGTAANPERLINLYFSLSGDLLACYDPQNGPPDSYLSVKAAASPGKGKGASE
jgi:hypothetical protein